MINITKKTTKKKKVQPIMVSSYEEVEKIIYSLLQEGKNPREISQIEFIIDGISKKHNPNQIHKIKEKFESKTEKTKQDPDKAILFELFKEGMSPTYALIKTKLDYEFVKNSWNQFLELEEKQEIPKQIAQDLFSIASTYERCTNYYHLRTLFRASMRLFVETHGTNL